MHRAVTALLGPTNTGKTHRAIERMLTHASGMIGFPLRLLARENYDRVAARAGGGRRARHGRGARRAARGRPTGCARSRRCRSTCKVDFLAVDEIQLAADRERGHVFTDRLLHARGPPRDAGSSAPTRSGRSCASSCPTPRSTRGRASRRCATRSRSGWRSCPALGGHRVLHARALRGGGAPAPRAGRGGARLRRALAAHAQRAGRRSTRRARWTTSSPPTPSAWG